MHLHTYDCTSTPPLYASTVDATACAQNRTDNSGGFFLRFTARRRVRCSVQTARRYRADRRTRRISSPLSFSRGFHNNVKKGMNDGGKNDDDDECKEPRIRREIALLSQRGSEDVVRSSRTRVRDEAAI